MHDWTLVSILIDWVHGTITMTFKNHESKHMTLIAERILDLHVPRREEWGESVSVNKVIGPTLLKNGNYRLEIEIQSGDKISLEANSIRMPKGFD